VDLDSIDRLQILEKLWKEIVIPKAIYREVVEIINLPGKRV